MTARARFVELASRRLNRAIVLWRGKGYFIFDVDAPGSLRTHGFPSEVFDCSGLVSVSLMGVGGPDLRATHNAAAFFAASEPVEFLEAQAGDLVFYGDAAAKPSHVAIADGNGGVVSADGATSRVLDFETALANTHARVHLHDSPHFRGDYLATHRNRWLDDLEAKEHGTDAVC